MTEQDIQHLRDRLHGLKLPNGPIELYQGTTVINTHLFVEAQLRILESNPNGKTPPAYDHLKDFISLVEGMQL